MDLGAIIFQSIWMYGLAIVIAICAAILIRAIVVILERRHQEAHPAPAAKPVAAPAAAPAAPEGETTAEHVAAITAAIYAMMGGHRIVRIEAAAETQSWASHGRWQIHTSHDVHHHHSH